MAVAHGVHHRFQVAGLRQHDATEVVAHSRGQVRAAAPRHALPVACKAVSLLQNASKRVFPQPARPIAVVITLIRVWLKAQAKWPSHIDCEPSRLLRTTIASDFTTKK